jgi:AraC-like DNA-binding protein
MISHLYVARQSNLQEAFHGDGFKIQRGIYSTENSERCSRSGLVIQLNDGAPFEFSWKSQGKSATGICEPGNFVQLLSQFEWYPLQCQRAYSAIELSFGDQFIDKILEKEKFSFSDRYNFHDPLLNVVITELYRSAFAKTAENLYFQSLAVACVIHLATTYTVNNKRIFSLKGKLSSHQLQRVIAFIRETISRPVTLEELATCCHLSVFHFSRLFKNSVGISPYQYVLRTKIEYARKLVKSKKAVGDIAYSLGFTDSAHFCNAFKRFTGHSPLQYVAVTKGLGVAAE